MEQKFGIALNSRLNIFSQKFGIDRTLISQSDFFELFSNYVVISNLLGEDFEGINKISTRKSKGIDGIGIVINNKLITDESDLDKIGENEKLHLKFCFIQSTTQSSFDMKKFQAFIDEIVNFLIGTNQIDPFSDIFSKKLFNEDHDYLDRLKETPKIYIYFISGCTNHSVSTVELDNEKRKIIERNEFHGKFTLEGLFIWQENELNTNFENIDKFLEVPVKFHKSKQLDEKKDVDFSLIASVKFEELRKLIETKDGNLREKLFIENPRSVIENSTVNDEIKKTLSDANSRDYFIYLNNGITILCDKIKRHEFKEDVFYLTYPRIINGCQTTHMLYDYHENNLGAIDNLDIFVKAIATENKDLKKKIIFATNNQNSIDKDLQALNEFHAKLEEYFQGKENFEIFYERLRGQYSKVNPPYKKIDIENLAKVYLSVFNQVPHEMKSNAIKRIEKYQTRGTIFRGEEYSNYYYCAILFYYLNLFLTNNIIVLNSQTMDMHLLMCCELKLNKDNTNSIEKKIELLRDIEFAKNLFISVTEIVNNQVYLFERRGFYSAPKTAQLINFFET
ncbi:MAG: AIPR family protein [Leptospiraceae bacterium]|nr:AIPR family protein [Leptospiraceae bacterium]